MGFWEEYYVKLCGQHQPFLPETEKKVKETEYKRPTKGRTAPEEAQHRKEERLGDPPITAEVT